LNLKGAPPRATAQARDGDLVMEKITSAKQQTARFDFDLDDLLHPAQAFEHPRRVVEDPDLTLNRFPATTFPIFQNGGENENGSQIDVSC
jgi:hypothetical protein